MSVKSNKSVTSTKSRNLAARRNSSSSHNWGDLLDKRRVTTAELNKIPQCCPSPRDEPYMPSCICIQQTPRIVCRKNIVWVQKVTHEPHIINATRIVMIPKVICVDKVVRIPRVDWTKGCIYVPRIIREPRTVEVHEVREKCRSMMVPQEICTTFLCRPKPQKICIPPPTDYCCYPLDLIRGTDCPPVVPPWPWPSWPSWPFLPYPPITDQPIKPAPTPCSECPSVPSPTPASYSMQRQFS